jgi:hypothetical protein
MIIHLNHDWRIASDPLQWIIQKRRTVKGQDKWDSLAFFGDLDRAVVHLARRRVRMLPGSYGPEALPVLCQALDRLKAEISTALSAMPRDRASLTKDD